MITRAAVLSITAIAWIAAWAALNASMQDLSRFAGTWKLERVEPLARGGDAPAALLTIDVSGKVVTVTSTILGGAAGMRTTVDVYEVDGTERPLKSGSSTHTTRTSRAAPRGFEVIETVMRGAEPIERTTERWSMSPGGRVTIESVTGEQHRTRRTYFRR